MSRPGKAIQATALAMAAMLALPQFTLGAATVQFPPPHSSAYTHDQQIQLGEQGDQEVRHQMQVLPDSDPIAQYVRRLGERLVPYVPNTSQNPRYPYSFHVVNLKEINAFSLPGGPVYVNLGTIQATANEAQLAGVIAHEMGHTYEQHAAAQATREGFAQVGLGVLGAILGGGVGGTLARTGATITANAYFLHYSRGDESEADHVGALLMYEAGYNPQALADFFRKLEEQGNSGPQFLSDHPDPGNRAQAIASLVRTLPARQFNAGDPEEFQQMHQLALSMRAPSSANSARNGRGQGQGQGQGQGRGGNRGDDRSAGGEYPDNDRDNRNGGSNPDDDEGPPPLTRGSAQPNGSFHTLDHVAYRMQYPSNWQIVTGDQTSDVTIAPPSGVAGSAISYGVMIRSYEPESQQLDSALHELEQDIRQANPDLRIVGHDEPITVNRVQGRAVDMIGTSPLDDPNGQPAREHDWLVMVPWQQDRDIYLVFVAPANDFDRLRPTFEQMLKTLELK